MTGIRVSEIDDDEDCRFGMNCLLLNVPLLGKDPLDVEFN